jgi:hypothetical protein
MQDAPPRLRGAAPVRLGHHAHTVALGFQESGNHGMTKTGMIHIGIPGNEEKINGFPAARGHVLAADRQECLTVSL